MAKKTKRYRVIFIITTTIQTEERIIEAVDEGTSYMIEEVYGKECNMEQFSVTEEPLKE